MIVVLVFTLVVYATAVAGQEVGVSDAVAARIDAQAWRVDRLTKQFQTISDLADTIQINLLATSYVGLSYT